MADPQENRYIHDDEQEEVRLTGVKQTWKCKSCSKLSTGFVVPFGRCFLCGGELEVIEPYSGPDADKVAIIQEAVSFEVNMHTFYKLALEKATHPHARAVLEDLAEQEREHIDELNEKYHLDLPTDPKELETGEGLSGWLFEGVDFSDKDGQVLPLFDHALELERRTQAHFAARAEAATGRDRAFFEELAAEEAEHVSLLEAQRDQFLGD